MFAKAIGIFVASVAPSPRRETFVGEVRSVRTGQLHLPLVTPTEDRFQLRSARFEIENRAGTLVATLDADANPEATALEASSHRTFIASS